MEKNKRLLMKTILAIISLIVIVRIFSEGNLFGRLQEHREVRQVQMNDELSSGLLGEQYSSGDALVPSGIRVERDVSYGSNPYERFDAYIPSNAQGAPVLFMVHGGAWRIGAKDTSRVVDNKIAYWLPKGYIFISIDYPMLPDANPLQQADFVGKALAYAQTRVGAWGGDATRFVLVGHSAGAHLVSLISADASIATSQGARPWLGTVSLDSAAYDVSAVMNAKHFSLYDKAFGTDTELWKKASPLERLTGEPAPVLLVCSSQRLDSCEQANTFAEKVTEQNGIARVLVENLSHGEINTNLGIPGAYTEAVTSFLHSLGLP